MNIEIVSAGPGCLPEYGTVSIAFEVRALLRPVLLDGGLGGIALHEEPVQPPYVKDYDASEEGGPMGWAEEWDLSSWGFFLARHGGRCIAAAAVAFETAEINMLEGRDDLAVLWDIRVAPGHRGRGLGRRLFWEAAGWAREQGCRQLKVETQNVNLPACRFYAAQGCRLGAIHRYGYAGQPHVAHEAMLLWYLDLSPRGED
ncbi:MAG: GNAT family N-acetyltransferase [Anaerolineae bacterium]